MNRKEYASTVRILKKFKKSMSNKWLNKSNEIFNFLTMINSSVAVGLDVLLLIMSVIIASSTINIFCVLSELYLWIFL